VAPDPTAIDELSKQLAHGRITRRKALRAFAGTIVAGAFLGGPYRMGGNPIFGPATAQAFSLPTCNVAAGVSCDLLCAVQIRACSQACVVLLSTECLTCLKEAYSNCDDCPEYWDCTCTTGYACPGTGVGGALSGTPGICCDRGQTCFSPGICQGPCTPCEKVTIVGCAPNCPSGSGCCNDQCVDLTTPANCGACGRACQPDEICLVSSPMCPTCAFCTTCASGTACGKQCCPEGEYCEGANGQCSCGGASCGFPNTCCTAQCVDTDTDPANCGSCGHTCPANASACCNGQCVDTDTDLNNCGGCGIECTAGEVCYLGRCVCFGRSSQGTCQPLIYCGCNGTCWTDVQSCLANCQATLACFSDICGPAQPGQCP
jgi:hypothetical protein